MADFGKADIDAVSLEDIAAEIQRGLIQQSMLVPFVRNEPVRPGLDMVKIGLGGTFSAVDKVAATDLTTQSYTVTTDDLLLDKHKAVPFSLEDIADVQALPNILADAIDRATRQLALKIDEDIVACLEATSAAGPDHRLAFDNATSLGKTDILEARKLLKEQNAPVDELVMGVSPLHEKELLAITDFVHADTYGNAMGLQRGVLGTLYGMPVICSNAFNDLKVIVWHKDHVAYATQMNIRLEQQRQVLGLKTDYVLSTLYGCKVLRGGILGVMLGTAA